MAHRTTVCNWVGTTLGILAILCVAPPASADVTLNTLGTWGGRVDAVQVEGDLAYVAAGRRLVILNIADPANLLEIGSIDLGSVVLDVAVRDGYAYVGTWLKPNHFCVVDVSQPANPRLVWRYEDDGQFIADEVDLYPPFSYAYVRDDLDLHVFDISDPEGPVYLGLAEWSRVRDSAIVGDLMYMVDRYKHVRIYDLATGSVIPPLLGIVTLPGEESFGSAIAVEGAYACATTKFRDGVLAVVDVLDPEAPVVMGSWQGFLFANDVAVSNGFAYVADWPTSPLPSLWEEAKGLVIFDVATDPSNPTLVGTYKTHGAVWGVEVVGNIAYVFDEGEGLILLDLSDPVNPVRLGNYHSPAELRKMAKVGDLLYVTDEWNGITILDVSDPVRPTPVGVYQTAMDGLHMDNWSVEVRNQMAYFTTGWAGFEVVDVSDPANPVLIGEFSPWPEGVQAMALKLNAAGDIAHVGTKPGAFVVNFDVTDPQNIIDVKAVNIGGIQPFVYTIDTTPEGILHVARDLALVAVDSTDVENPFVIGQQDMVDPVDLVLEGSIRYVANDNSDEEIGGLYIQDVSDPTNPVVLGRFPTHFGTAVAIQDQRAYFAGVYDGYMRLSLLDVSVPTAPSLLTNAVLTDLSTSGDLLTDERFVHVTGAALTIFQLSIPGDLNGDGCVDQSDLGILLADWGCAGGDCPGDADGDGDTDHSDLGILLAHWGEGC